MRRRTLLFQLPNPLLQELPLWFLLDARGLCGAVRESSGHFRSPPSGFNAEIEGQDTPSRYFRADCRKISRTHKRPSERLASFFVTPFKKVCSGLVVLNGPSTYGDALLLGVELQQRTGRVDKQSFDFAFVLLLFDHVK
jgi:hypothetical protein